MRAHYNFASIEKKWQVYWDSINAFVAKKNNQKRKFYILDMFPYPSGKGLHVGHGAGYIPTDVITRYYHAKGYNVLHPMGFDAFGLPAEQYAIEAGQHPAITTQQNIDKYKKQFKALGLAIDWSKEISTADPSYYKWTQWIFLQFFDSWYNQATKRAKPITTLKAIFQEKGNTKLEAACDDDTPCFTAKEWKTFSKNKQESILHHYRLAYLSETMVNWCPALRTVLANSEVKQGLSERGGHPVIKKKMKQWSLRITAYADRLLADLDRLEWPKAIKTMQTNWIGKTIGTRISFTIDIPQPEHIDIFTTRPETIFGTSYLALSLSHPFLAKITKPATTFIPNNLKKELQAYIRANLQVHQNHEQAITGIFTGLYGYHPFTNQKLPIWISNYVLADYGTGAIMGVPAHDDRDHMFAKHFDLPIKEVIAQHHATNDIKTPYKGQEGILINSGFLNDLTVEKAVQAVMKKLETSGQGKSKVCYRMHDAVFSRQRYWGEPLPIYYKKGIPQPFQKKDLPLVLPNIEDYKPTEAGEPPLARASAWHKQPGEPIEYSTMPAWAGSSWYFLRYMDPANKERLVSQQAVDYWKAVDLYIGGAEHATSHLLYARFFTKFLYDRGFVNLQEPFTKLLNQGMIQGTSHFVYRIKGSQQFVSHGLKDQYDTMPLYVDINLVKKGKLDLQAFKKWRKEFANATFILEEGQYVCGELIEKMSKSKHNTVQPNQVIAKYGADTLRLYLIFLGPLEQCKPWNTQGIKGIYRFLQKVWKLFHTPEGNLYISEQTPNHKEVKAIHKAIKEVTDCLDRYTFNTAISAMMICVNTLNSLNCNKRIILEDLLRLLAPFAPHIAEELWNLIGHEKSILYAGYPTHDPRHLAHSEITYPLAINGKVRAKINLPSSATMQELEKAALQAEPLEKWLQGKQAKRVIIVPGKMINIII